MDDDQNAIVEDNADIATDEDQSFDNFEEAMDALQDDNEDDEQPAEAEADSEAEDETDPDGDEEETEAEPEGDAEGDSEDETVYELPDGETISLSEIAELKANGLRDSDYRKKTTEVADQRKALEAEQTATQERAQYLETTFENLTEYLTGLIPPEPPLQLAQTDPNAYQYQKALRDQSLAELQTVFQAKDSAKSKVQEFSEADLGKLRDAETSKLVEAMPHLSDPVKKAAFDENVKKSAMEFGFSEAEINGAVDNRMFQLVHYAALGKKAESNRKNAKRRVETPKTVKAKRATASQDTVRQRQAKKRFSQNPSMSNAMSVDFD